jgi:uncharacterized YceG family protein
MPGQPASAPRGGQPRRRAGRRILALLALLAIGAALFLINATFQPFHSEGRGAVGVTIPEGADAGQIGDRLASAGVVDSGRFFMLNATLTGRRGKLKPGEYTLPRNMSNGDAVEALQQGPKAKIVKTFNVTVPEGRSIREAAPLIEESPVRGDYLKAARSRKTIRRARRLGLPGNRRTAEGFLFPATYELVSDATAQQLVDRQLKGFSDNLSEIDMRVAKRRNLTRYDVVIIASMIEREAQADRERPLISSVIHNRLRDGIPLGIDATTRYFENNWSEPLKQSELQRDNPFNTRLNRGLPPTPIGSPGLKSLQAAAKPANSKYLYYVAKPGTCGHTFAETDAEFQRAVDRYEAARRANGGKSPTKC